MISRNNMNFNKLILICFGVLLLAAPKLAMAQSDEYQNAEVDQTGACPEFDRYTLRKAGLSFIRKRDLELFTSPYPDAFTVDKKFETPFEPVRVLAHKRLGDNDERFFVRAMETDFCAWLPRSAVFAADCFFEENGAFNPQGMRQGPRPMTAKQIDEKRGYECRPQSQSGLFRKLVMHNLNQTTEESANEGVALYSSSGGPLMVNGNQRQLKVFDAFYVFDRMEIKEDNHAVNYYLIGRREDNSDVSRNGRMKILGYVHDKDSFPWDTRYAAFWAQTGNARGFKQLRHLANPDLVVMREPVNYQLNSDQVAAAFPIERETVKGEEGAAESTVRLILPSVACADEKENCTTTSDSNKKRQEILRQIESLGVIDIKFLIDNSKSMDAYFGIIAKAVKEIRGELVKLQSQALQNPSVRISVSTYGDYQGGRSSVSSVEFKTIFAFSSVTASNVADRLKQALRKEVIRRPSDPEHDLREASFAGVIRATKDVRWRQDASFKVIIHIADHGNREYGSSSNERKNGKLVSNLIESVSQDLVANSLCKAGIYYAPIAVRGTKYNSVANRAFVSQGPLIQRAMLRTKECKKFYLNLVKTYNGSGTDNPEDSYSKIYKGFQSVITIPTEEIRSRLTIIECIQNNGENCFPADPPPSNPRQSAGWQGQIVSGLRAQHGFSERQIRNIYGQSQTVSSLFFPTATKDKENFTYWLAMPGTALSTLAKTYSKLCGLYGGGTVDQFDVRDALLRLVADASGDDYLDDVGSAQEFMDRMMDFPAQHLNDSMVNRSWHDLEELLEYGSPVDKKKYAMSVCRTSELLEAMRVKRKVDIGQMSFVEPSDGEFGYWDIPDEARQDYIWSVSSNNGVKLFYVPLEFFEMVQ